MKQGTRPGEDKEELHRREEEEDDSEDEEGEEEEEDEEPKLKYQRLGFSVLDILKDDSATCMHVHEKFLVCALAPPSLCPPAVQNSNLIFHSIQFFNSSFVFF
jgi:hypothetical protein